MFRFDFLGRRLAQIKTDNKKELKLIALEMSKPATRNSSFHLPSPLKSPPEQEIFASITTLVATSPG